MMETFLPISILHKKNLKYNTLKELALPADSLQHIMKDEIIELANEIQKRNILAN